MQRAGRQAKKDNTNGAKSSKGSASANQNVININLGELTERGERKRPRAKKKKDDRPPKKPRSAKAKPAKKKPVAKPDVARLVDLKKQYMELTRSVDMRMIPEGCSDVPDRLLTPTTPEQVRELIRYLEDCIRKIRLTSSRGMIPPSGISVSPTPGMPPPPPPGAGGVRLPGMPYSPFPPLPQKEKDKDPDKKPPDTPEKPPKKPPPPPDAPEKPPKKDEPPPPPAAGKPPKTVQVVQDEGAFNKDVEPPQLGGRNAPEVRQYVEALIKEYKLTRQQMLASIRGRESETTDDVIMTLNNLWASQLAMANVLDVIETAIRDENLNSFTPATRQRLETFMNEQISEFTSYVLNRDPLPPFTQAQANSVVNQVGDAITFLPSPWGRVLAEKVIKMAAMIEGRPYEELVRDRSTWMLVAQYALTAATPLAAIMAGAMANPGIQQALAFGAFNAPGMAGGALVPAAAAIGGPIPMGVLIGSGIAAMVVAARQLVAEGQPLPIGNGGGDPGDDDDDDDAFDAMVRRLDARTTDLRQKEQGVSDRLKAKDAYEAYVRGPGRRVLSPYEQDAQMVIEARQLMASTSEDDEKYRLVSQAVNRFLQEQQRFFRMISEQYTPPDLADFAGGIMAGGPGSSLGQPQQPPPDAIVPENAPQDPQGPDTLQSGVAPNSGCPDTHPKLCSAIKKRDGTSGQNGGKLCLRMTDRCDRTRDEWSLTGEPTPRAMRILAWQEKSRMRGIQMQPDDGVIDLSSGNFLFGGLERLVNP